MLDVLAQIGQPNFGLIYEPANLLLNGQPYGLETLKKLRPHLMNVYVQNHKLNPAGTDELPTFCRGNVRFDHLPPWTPGGVSFEEVATALKQVGYDGTFTLHQAQGIQSGADARKFAGECAESFGPLVRGGGDSERRASACRATTAFLCLDGCDSAQRPMNTADSRLPLAGHFRKNAEV